MDFVKKHKKEITISAGIVTATGILAGVWHLFSKKRLPLETISCVYDAIADSNLEEYTSIVKEFRKERRAATSPSKYVQAYNRFQENYTNVMKQLKREVLKDLDISEKHFDSSIESYKKEGNQDLKFIQTSFRHKMTAKIPCENSHVGASFMKVTMRQIEYLVKNRDALVEFASLLKSPEQFPGLIWAMLNDHVYEVFKLEEEDLAAIVIDRPKEVNDPDVMKLVANLLKEISKIEEEGKKRRTRK